MPTRPDPRVAAAPLVRWSPIELAGMSMFLAAIVAVGSIPLLEADGLPFGLLALGAIGLCMVSLAMAAREPSGSVPVLVYAIAILFIDFGAPALVPYGYGLLVKGVLYGMVIWVAMFAGDMGRHEAARAGTGSMAVALFLAYSVFGWLTITYSEDRLVTLHTGFALFAVAIAALSLSRASVDRQVATLRLLARAATLFAAISIALYAVVPHRVIAFGVAGENRLSGLFASPNALGPVCVVAIVVLAWSLLSDAREGCRRTPWSDVACMAVCGIALALTGSRTSMLGALAGFGVMVAIARPGKAIAAALLLALVGVLGLAYLDAADAPHKILLLFARTSTGEDIYNLTGRVAIWEFSASRIAEAPWLGYGLGASRDLIATGYDAGWGNAFQSAHNALLESLLNVGILGTLLLASVFVAIFHACIKLWRAGGEQARSIALLALSLTTVVLVLGLAEKAFAGTPSFPTGVLALTAALVHSGTARMR